MKPSKVLLGLLLSLSSSLAFAENNLPINAQELSNRIETISNEIGISKERYLYASKQYFRTLSEDHIDGFPKIQDRDLYQLLISSSTSELSFSEQKLAFQRLQNEINSDLASFLGLDISELSSFKKVFIPLINNQQNNKSSDLIITPLATPGGVESIEVLCDDNCRSAFTGSTYTLNLYIYNSATQIGIPPRDINNPGSSFIVKFKNKNTGVTVKSERWAYNDFSGAWKIHDAPCSSCHVDY